MDENLNQAEDGETEQETLCVLCYENARDSDLTFCQCNYKVHHECVKMMLLQWEDSVHHVTGMRCLSCNCEIELSIQPLRGILTKGMEKLTFRYRWICEKLSKFFVFVAVQQALTTYGLAILYQIYGKEAADEITNSFNPIIAVGICQSIPLTTMAITSCGWEDMLLVRLRRCSELPVVGGLFPRQYPGVREMVYDRRSSLLVVLIDSMMLPAYAELCGLLLLRSTGSRLRHLLLGGAAFLSVRGLLYMYFRQSRYSFLGTRAVANYRDKTNT